MRTHTKLAAVLAAALAGLVALTLGANAGEYYYAAGHYGHGHGYYGHHYYGHHYAPGYTHVWYSSSCCYRRIVRYSRTVHYARLYHYGHYYHGGAYYHGGGHYGAHYYGAGYYSHPYHGYYHPRRYYAGYYDAAVGGCYVTRVRVDDHRGGWVWGRRRICY